MRLRSKVVLVMAVAIGLAVALHVLFGQETGPVRGEAEATSAPRAEPPGFSRARAVGVPLVALGLLVAGAALWLRPLYREVRRLREAEELVRTRSAQLEEANALLAESLKRQQATQGQLVLADRLASMGQLAAGVGHEINNPLAYVLSNLSFVHKELSRTRGAPAPEELEELLTAVADAREGAERVRLIVQDLKLLSRADDAAMGPVELGEVLRRVVKLAGHEVGRRARLVEQLGELPRVRGSEVRLGQVFLNLLLNAAQAIPRGKVEENEVRVEARREGEEGVVVEVSDTGCGIAPENLERIFDPFFTTKPVGEGTGLGLSVCHGIIQSYGGQIRVESTLGRGTTFRVSLRVEEGAAEEQEEARVKREERQEALA